MQLKRFNELSLCRISMRPRTANKCELNLNKDFLIGLLRSRKQFIKLWENLSSMTRFWAEIKEILVGQLSTQRTEGNIEWVRQLIEENPHWYVRRNGTGLSQSSLHRILKNDIKAHPYKNKIKHQLLEPDFARRMTFCNWLLDHGPRFIDTIVVTDEDAFSMNGRVNTQNTRHWYTHPSYGNVFEKSIRRDKIGV